MEEVEFIRKCTKPNSTEVNLVKAEPNPAFFRFTGELQLSDKLASAFQENVEIIQDEIQVGNLNVELKIIHEKISFDNRRYNKFIEVKSHFFKKNNRKFV